MEHIIGISGTLGAGKGTAVQHLVERLGFVHCSVSRFIMEEVQRRDLPMSRDNTRIVGTDLRTQFGPSYIVDQLYRQAAASGKPAIIESIRAIGEANFMLMNGGTLLAIDADRRLRYERIRGRNSLIDHVDYETFVLQEEAEMASTDPNAQNIEAVMRLSHHRILNNGSPEELFSKLDQLFPTFA